LRRELLSVFFDDWKYDFVVRVVRFDSFLNAPAIPSQYITTSCVRHEHSPLDIATSLALLTTLPSQNHPSNGLVPLSSLARGSKNQERGQSAHHGNPPLELDPEPRIPSGPNPSRDLIDPSEISVNGGPARPNDRASLDLPNKIADGDHRG
jgi:hypothetical protein